MAKAIHFKCDIADTSLPTNVTIVDPSKGAWCSGYWDLSEDQARALVGGWLYLHETKKSPSYYGGQISDFKVENRSGVAHTARIGLIFKPDLRLCKGRIWRGQDHTRAWTGGLVEADLLYEKETT